MAVAHPENLAPPSDDAGFTGNANTTSAVLELIRADRVSGAETYALTDGMTLTQDGEEATFNTVDFVAIGAATAAEVVAVINTDWTTNSATDTGGDFTVTGDDELTGTALAALGLAAAGNKVESVFTIAGPARIMALMNISSQSTGGGQDAVGGWAVQIDGVNGREYARELDGTRDRMMGGANMRSDPLPAGTYSIKGMHRRVSGTRTVQTNVAGLLCWPVAP